jgi:hypothetical protein
VTDRLVQGPIRQRASCNPEPASGHVLSTVRPPLAGVGSEQIDCRYQSISRSHRSNRTLLHAMRLPHVPVGTGRVMRHGLTTASRTSDGRMARC